MLGALEVRRSSPGPLNCLPHAITLFGIGLVHLQFLVHQLRGSVRGSKDVRLLSPVVLGIPDALAVVGPTDRHSVRFRRTEDIRD